MSLEPETDKPDGYAVLLHDKASGPCGYWFAGLYHSKEIADDLASKLGKHAEVRPIKFI